MSKVVILCGGRGTRMEKETEYRPKPMVEIGDRPILWHIMKVYAHYGFNEFILCLGYKGEVIRNYFLNFAALTSDVTVHLGKGKIEFPNAAPESEWKVTLVDTGLDALTGARIKKIEKYIDEEPFLLTYGDAVANVNIGKLVKFHMRHRKTATVTGVYPVTRSQFGELGAKGIYVREFLEKPSKEMGLVNGGFFVFNKNIFNYLTDDDACTFEKEPIERLANDGELAVYKHRGFWQCMDTIRDFNLLNELYRGEMSPWFKLDH